MGGSASKALGEELVAAAYEGDTGQVQTLLAAKAPVDHTNKYGTTSLMKASIKGHIAPMEVLLAAKANVDQADKHGATALRYASVEGDSALVELLLAAKANVDQAANDGQTALSLASYEGHSELAELLEFWSELTPLMLAVVTQSPQEIKALLHEGADPTWTVLLPSGIETAHSLAINDPPRTWFSATCLDTVDLIESSLTWSVESHYLFPPGFRRGVKHVYGLKVALDRADHQLSNPVWMMIISHLPRHWAAKEDSGHITLFN